MPSGGAEVTRTHNLQRNAARLQAALKVSLKRAGLVVKARAQELAPELTGQMTRSVTVGEPHMVGNRMVVDIGPRTSYAPRTELEPYVTEHPGLGAISRAKGARKPWLRPALHEVLPEATAILARSIVVELRKIGRR